MKSSCCPVTTSIAIGVAAGAIGACVMLLMRQFDRAYAPKTIPHTPNDTPPQMDPVTRQPIPTHSITAAPQPIIAPLVCGAIAAGVYGLARGRHAHHSALAHGLLLGGSAYAAGAFAIMPALGVIPPPWKQTFPEIGGELLRHVVFGITAVATYGLIDHAGGS